MKMRRHRNMGLHRLLILTVVGMLLLAACGGDSDAEADPTDTSTAGTEPSSESTMPTDSSTPSPDTTSEGSEVEEVVIGGTYPMTGPLGSDGQEMVNSIQIAVDEINDAGGLAALGGAEVRFEAIDSEGSPDLAATNVERLIGDGAHAIIGAWLSSNTLATTQVAERAGIPHIVDQSLSNEILARGFEYTFRVMFSPESVGDAGTRWLDEYLDRTGLGRSVVFMHEDSPFGSTNAEEWLAQAENYDFEVLEVIPYAASSTDLSTEVARAIATEADLFLHVGYAPDSLLTLRTLDEQGADFDAIVGIDSAAWYNQRFADEAGDLINGVLDAASYPINRDDAYDAYVAEYESRFGATPSDGGAMSYSSAKVLMEAIDQAGTTDPDAIREVLATGSFDPQLLAQDSVSFNEVGQNDGLMPLMYQWIDGSREVIIPDEFATAEPQIP